MTATQELESIVLKNLKPSALYLVLIQAKTNAGIGPAATAPPFSTLEESKLRNVRKYKKYDNIYLTSGDQ